MFVYKKIFSTAVLSLISLPAFSAENCEPLPDCVDIGFKYSASDCGSLEKMKCPFDDIHYFCSLNNQCTKVTFNSSTHYCTQYCTGSTDCAAATMKSCTTTANTGLFGTGGVGGTLFANETYKTSGTFSGKLYLLGSAEFTGPSTKTSNGTTFYNASHEYSTCNITNTVSLKLNGTTLLGDNIFWVPVTMRNMYYYGDTSNPSRWTGRFYEDTDIEMYYNAGGTNVIEFTLGKKKNNASTNHKLCIKSGNLGNLSSTNKMELRLIAMGGAKIKYYFNNIDSAKYTVNCVGDGSGRCESDSSVCAGL